MLSQFPGYVLNRKTYKTAAGILTAIAKDCGAASVSMVKDNAITCRAEDRKTVVAVYDVTPPEEGKKMYVERVRDITKDLAHAAVASAYNTDPARKDGDVPMCASRYTTTRAPALSQWLPADEMNRPEQARLVRAYLARFTPEPYSNLFNATELRLIAEMLEAA